MSETMIAWMETIFNALYLLVLWTLVILMSRKMQQVHPKDRKTANLFRVAFILLAAGDTGHVGFRVVNQLIAKPQAEVMIFGSPMSLLGLGILTTSFTITLFYMVLVYVWRSRYDQRSNWVSNLLLAAGVVRLVMMALPSNQWGAAVPVQPMSLYRNIPLMIQGIGIIFLILNSAYRAKDRVFQWIGWMIILSFGFYIPVILFAQQIPLIGMLMIPKTCAYLGIVFIAYFGIWKDKTSGLKEAASISS